MVISPEVVVATMAANAADEVAWGFKPAIKALHNEIESAHRFEPDQRRHVFRVL